jgi:hypothetical protein
MDLKDYIKVDDLIKRMNEEYPKGRLITEFISQIDDLVVFKATFYDGDSEAICTGHGAEKLIRDKKLEKAESVARGRCLRVLFSEKPLYEEMAQKSKQEPKQAPFKANQPIKEQMQDMGIETSDVSKSQEHINANIRDFAMELCRNDLDKARTVTAEALGMLNIAKGDININNLQTIKNKIQDIVTFSQVETDKGE